jgi:hypothetical protein
MVVAIAFVLAMLYEGGASASDSVRILFLGNSMTSHAPSPDLGWTGNWGMASSEARLDYAHVTGDLLSDMLKREVDINSINVSYFENAPLANVNKVAEIVKSASPSVLVIFLGDNVASDPSSIARFGVGYTALLGRFRGANLVLVCVGVWWASKMKDDELRKACSGAGGEFISLGELSLDTRNLARSERFIKVKGVGEHPGDRGMNGIARRIADRLSVLIK